MRMETRLVAGPAHHEGVAHVAPLDLSTTYRTDDLRAAARSIDELANGAADAENPVYARLHNPNVRDFERRMTAIEHGADSVAFASGMAAVAALVLDAAHRGGHIVAIPPVYGGTHHLLESGLLGTRVTWASPDEVGGAVTSDTALIWLETPSNPMLTLADIRAVVEAVRGVPVVVDSTFATPVLQNPLTHGASYALHSATKFIGGHGDAMGGVITTRSTDAAARLRQIRIATGAVLHPSAARLLSRGLQTLAMRVHAQQRNARELVVRLRRHRDVLAVGYPAVGADQSEPGQMSGPGSMVTLTLTGGVSRADAFIARLKLVVPAVSLGSVDTLVQRPAALTHHVLGADARAEFGVPEDLIRISVGAEDIEDLWADIEQAIAASSDVWGAQQVDLHAASPTHTGVAT